MPDTEMGEDGVCLGEQIEYFEQCRNDMKASKEKLLSDLAALVSNAKSCLGKGEPNVIVSAENLSCRNDFSSLFSGLSESCDIKIIIYIRRQDEYLLSFWQQWYLKVNDDFWAWVISSLKWIGDWSFTINPWVEVVGQENMILRRFSKRHFLNHDLIDDFSEILGIDSAEMFREHANPSFNDAVCELAFSVRDVFDGMHDNEFYQMIHDWVGSAAYKNKPSGLMNYAQRQAILNYYMDSNENIKKMFFDDEDEQLFEPLGDREKDLDTSGDLEGRIAMLTMLLYGRYSDNKKKVKVETEELGAIKNMLRMLYRDYKNGA